MTDNETYGIEGVMDNVSQGWILALDRPFDGQPNDTLFLAHTEPPVPVNVIGLMELEDGSGVPDVIVIYPVQDMNDPRLLTGRTLVAQG